jgi:hypothetical protein
MQFIKKHCISKVTSIFPYSSVHAQSMEYSLINPNSSGCSISSSGCSTRFAISSLAYVPPGRNLYTLQPIKIS